MADSQTMVVTFITAPDGRVKINTVFKPAMASSQEEYDGLTHNRKLLQTTAGAAVQGMFIALKEHNKMAAEARQAEGGS